MQALGGNPALSIASRPALVLVVSNHSREVEVQIDHEMVLLTTRASGSGQLDFLHCGQSECAATEVPELAMGRTR